MSQKKVVITIQADGTSVVEAVGFKGGTCTLATRELELALAGDMSNVEDKKGPDFFQSITPTQKLGN